MAMDAARSAYLKEAEREAELGAIDISQEVTFIRILGSFNVMEIELHETEKCLKEGLFESAREHLLTASSYLESLRKERFMMNSAQRRVDELQGKIRNMERL